jgi:hypothetical protein
MINRVSSNMEVSSGKFFPRLPHCMKSCTILGRFAFAAPVSPDRSGPRRAWGRLAYQILGRFPSAAPVSPYRGYHGGGGHRAACLRNSLFSSGRSQYNPILSVYLLQFSAKQSPCPSQLKIGRELLDPFRRLCIMKLALIRPRRLPCLIN